METEQLIVEDFCTRYKKFKEACPTAGRAKLREAFNSICSDVYTKFISEMPLLDIHNIQNFKSFLNPLLQKRREINRIRNEEMEVYLEIQQIKFAIEKARRDKEALEIKESYDRQPTFVFH